MNAEGLTPARRHIAAAAAVLVTGAGWIHLLAAENHRAHAHVAAFFIAVSLLQLGWAALVLYDATRRLLMTGLIGNLGLVLLWVLSRTTGVMFVPRVQHVEPVGVPDAAASALELVAAAALSVLLTTRKGELAPAGARRLVAGTASVTLLLVVAAGATGTAHHQVHSGPGESTGGDHAVG